MKKNPNDAKVKLDTTTTNNTSNSNNNININITRDSLPKSSSKNHLPSSGPQPQDILTLNGQLIAEQRRLSNTGITNQGRYTASIGGVSGANGANGASGTSGDINAGGVSTGGVGISSSGDIGTGRGNIASLDEKNPEYIEYQKGQVQIGNVYQESLKQESKVKYKKTHYEEVITNALNSYTDQDYFYLYKGLVSREEKNVDDNSNDSGDNVGCKNTMDKQEENPLGFINLACKLVQSKNFEERQRFAKSLSLFKLLEDDFEKNIQLLETKFRKQDQELLKQLEERHFSYIVKIGICLEKLKQKHDLNIEKSINETLVSISTLQLLSNIMISNLTFNKPSGMNHK